MTKELERKEVLAKRLGVSVDDIKNYESDNEVFMFKVYSEDLDTKVNHEDEVWAVQTYAEARKSMVWFIEGDVKWKDILEKRFIQKIHIA